MQHIPQLQRGINYLNKFHMIPPVIPPLPQYLLKLLQRYMFAATRGQ